MKEETKVALMQRDLENIKKSQERMEIKFDSLQGIFWTTRGHEEFLIDVDKRFINLETQASFRQYFLPIISSLATAIITFLLISFLQHAH